MTPAWHRNVRFQDPVAEVVCCCLLAEPNSVEMQLSGFLASDYDLFN